MNINVFVPGEPYCQNKTRGNIEGLRKWSPAIIEATKGLPRTSSACKVEITFVLPSNKYPADHPYGSDLDNLLKRFFDALNKTIFIREIKHNLADNPKTKRGQLCQD